MSSLQSKKASVAFLGFLFFIRWYNIAYSPIADISSASISEEYVFRSSLNSVSFFSFAIFKQVNCFNSDSCGSKICHNEIIGL